MKKVILILITMFLISCNPQMHLTSNVMRKHNTSQNTKKPAKLGNSSNSLIFYLMRIF